MNWSVCTTRLYTIVVVQSRVGAQRIEAAPVGQALKNVGFGEANM